MLLRQQFQRYSCAPAKVGVPAPGTHSHPLTKEPRPAAAHWLMAGVGFTPPLFATQVYDEVYSRAQGVLDVRRDVDVVELVTLFG